MTSVIHAHVLAVLGAKHYGGRVTLKFLLKHANSNESAYSDLVDILKKQISKSEAMR